MGFLTLPIVWLGLFFGVENTSAFPSPFQQPGLTTTTAVLFDISKNTVRIGYIHPIQKGGYGPALQIGVSRRIF